MMGERLRTRREAVAESQERPEWIKSVEALQKMGVLTPLKDLELYHGRSGNGERWHVANLDNSGNNTGNHNVNKIPALHTSDYDTARDFAVARTRRKRDNEHKTSVEVHRIVSEDADASIIDTHFDWGRLSSQEYERAKQVMKETVLPVFEGSPLKFEDRYAMDGLKPSDFRDDNTYDGYIAREMVPYYARKNHLPMELTEQICGAINARRFLMRNPEVMGAVVGAFVENTGETKIRFGEKGEVVFPINTEYVASWLKKIHAVGTKQTVFSATLQKKIDTYMLFDHERVDTSAEVAKKNEVRNRRFGKLALQAVRSQLFESEGHSAGESKSAGREVMNALNDPYAEAGRLVKAAKEVPGFRGVFEADAGNWEGFSLGEHTETVLRNFEYNYADRMPVEMLPLMKLSILMHDIGKSVAAQNGDKAHQLDYNIAMAERFMQEVGIERRNREFVLRMIGPGKVLVEDYIMGGRTKKNLKEVQNFCANTFRKYTGKRASKDDAHGIYSMILALQTCDSAAYTDMALTRSQNNREIVYRNAGVFNKSFESFGMTHRGAKLK